MENVGLSVPLVLTESSLHDYVGALLHRADGFGDGPIPIVERNVAQIGHGEAFVLEPLDVGFLVSRAAVEQELEQRVWRQARCLPLAAGNRHVQRRAVAAGQEVGQVGGRELEGVVLELHRVGLPL